MNEICDSLLPTETKFCDVHEIYLDLLGSFLSMEILDSSDCGKVPSGKETFLAACPCALTCAHPQRRVLMRHHLKHFLALVLSHPLGVAVSYVIYCEQISHPQNP